MKGSKLTAVFLALSLLGSPAALGAEHWAQPQLDRFVEEGYLKGDANGDLHPDGAITRSELCTLVNRVWKLPITGEKAFSDLSPEDWFWEAIQTAVAAGYLTGYEDGTVRPQNPVTRQELCVMLAKVLELEEQPEAADKFLDSGEFPAWSKGSIGALCEAGLIRGYEDGTFRPAVPVTRAEAVVILNWAMEEPAELEPDSGILVVPEEGLKDIETARDIRLEASVKNQRVILENVHTTGTLYLYGGGNNEITLSGSSFGNIIVFDEGGTSRVTLEDTAGPVRLDSGGTLAGTVSRAVLSESLSSSAQILLEGDFQEVSVTAPQVQVSHKEGTIEKLTAEKKAKLAEFFFGEGSAVDAGIFYAPVIIQGGSRIQAADFYEAGSTVDQKPKKRTDHYTVSQAGRGGGGGGGGNVSKPSPLPTPKPTPTGTPEPTSTPGPALKIEGGNQVLAGKTLILRVENAQGKVSWSGEGDAATVENGMVTGLKEGLYIVLAQDEGGNTARREIFVLAHPMEESRVESVSKVDAGTVLKIQSKDGAWTSMEQDITSAVKQAGAGVYRCEAWYKTDGPSTAARFFVGINDNWQERCAPAADNASWKKASFYIGIEDPAALNSLILKPVDNLGDFYAQPLYLAEIGVYRLGSTTNLVTNGTFGYPGNPVYGWTVTGNARTEGIDPNLPRLSIQGEHSVEQGATTVLTVSAAALNPGSAAEAAFVWHVEDPAVVTVEEGTVTGVGPGRTAVTVEAQGTGAQVSWEMAVPDAPLNQAVFEMPEQIAGKVLTIQKGAEWSNMEQNFSLRAGNTGGSIYRVSVCYRADAAVPVRMAFQYNNDWSVLVSFTAGPDWQRAVFYLRLPSLEAGKVASIKPFDNINDTNVPLQIADIRIEQLGAEEHNLIQNGQFGNGEADWSFAGSARTISDPA